MNRNGIRVICITGMILFSFYRLYSRVIENLELDWKFKFGDVRGAEKFDFDDSSWETVAVPHDWAIEGPFNKDIDVQDKTFFENGIKTTFQYTGRTGALPHIGTGWYRKKITFPQKYKGHRCFIEFDGAMSHARVYLNGEFIGTWPYGYSSFCFELTDKIHFNSENILAVRLENFPIASRWYPGAGIYRHVRMVLTAPVHVGHWGTTVTTPQILKNEAVVSVKTEVFNQTGQEEMVRLETVILDPLGRRIVSESSEEKIGKKNVFEQKLKIADPVLWDLDSPRIYKAVSKVIIKGEEIDSYVTEFGIRKFYFDKDKGFFLNGKNRKLNGVCLHHDLGPLGAAVNRRAIERQLEMLKDMGCNAVRTSHNPPAPELLNLCDKMGFIVIDEAFDEWKTGKCENGYHLLFDEWAEKDLRAMIRRDRNHPCIILWSIGNEIREQREKDGAVLTKYLTEICHDEDPTRPVTAGFSQWKHAIANGLADVVDVPGWNYKPLYYQQIHEDHPDWKMYASETASTVSSRGEYFFPAVEGKHLKHENLHSSSYDLEFPRWATTPDIEFAAQDMCSFIAGEFVWTGFDYLGEPTPYNAEWPSHSSYFGIIDLCGIPKDRFYLYQSRWSGKEVLHLLPHWNWKGMEGEIIPVHCYTSFDSAELFLNGKSLGIQKKDPSSKYKRYRLVWDSVKYEPGILKVIAFNDLGIPSAEKEIRTAGEPVRIMLTPDRKNFKADGKDLVFITVSILDKDSVLCPKSDNLIDFQVFGAGTLRAVGNGDPTSLESFQADYRKAFNGKCMLIVQSKREKGNVKITADSEGLKSCSVELFVQ
jgi:beta-galactosidase